MVAETATKRIPRDAFETALFRQCILHALERWPEDYGTTVSDDANGGEFSLSVFPSGSRTRFGSEVPSVLTGTVWLAELTAGVGNARIQVWWQLGDQQNHTQPPVVGWGSERD
jgi:hypothetical protein